MFRCCTSRSGRTCIRYRSCSLPEAQAECENNECVPDDDSKYGYRCVPVNECTDTRRQFRHNCSVGFECHDKEKGFDCKDVDECKLGLDNCGTMTCANTEGSYECREEKGVMTVEIPITEQDPDKAAELAENAEGELTDTINSNLEASRSDTTPLATKTVEAQVGCPQKNFFSQFLNNVFNGLYKLVPGPLT